MAETGRRKARYAEITVRTYQVTPTSVDRERRSVETVMATENVTRVLDLASWRVIDEVLLMSGFRKVDQVPLLDTHDRSSVQKVLGSTREIRVEGDKLVGRDFYSSVREGQAAFTKVEEGHVRDHSIGYRVVKAVTVEPGETQQVLGRKFTATSELPLRVVTEWELRENSVCAIGADGAAKTRSQDAASEPWSIRQKEEGTMSFKEWLTVRGLEEGKLTPEQTAVLRADYAAWVEARRTPSAPSTPSAGAGSITPASATPPNQESIISEQARTAVALALAERDRAEASRVSSIRQEAAAYHIPDGVVETCIRTNLDLAGARAEFLKHLQTGRPNTGPAIHATTQDLSREHLEAALMLRAGDASTAVKAYPKEVIGRAERISDMPLMDVVRYSLALDGIPCPVERKEMLRMAFSSASLPTILGNIANKSALRGYLDTPDTWRKFARIGSVSDFKTVTRARLTDSGELQLVNDAGEVAHGSAEEESEQFNIATYAKQFVITRKTIIDDDLGVFTRTPERFGRGAKLLVSKLFYLTLLRNGAMKDGKAVFHADHGNLNTSAPLGAAGMAKVLQSFRSIVDITGESIDLQPKFLLVPPSLEPTAKALLLSDFVIATALGSTSSAAVAPSANIYKGALELVVEHRLENKKYPGYSATSWYVMGDPAAADTIEVAFLNGQQTPTVERFDMGIDNLGIGFRVYLDVGAATIDHRNMQKCNA